MKRPVPFYPPLVAAFPVLALFSINLATVPLDNIWRPLAISVAGALALWAICSALFRSLSKGALLASIILAAFFSYGPISRSAGQTIAEIIVLLAIGVPVLALIRTASHLPGLTRALNFFGILLVVLPAAQVFVRRPPGSAPSYLDISFPVTATREKVATRPDIFFIVVDGYGRADQIRRVMGVDNEPFIQRLRSLGFYVADQSHSTYVQTQLSLASTLNMARLQDDPRVFQPNSDNRDPLERAMDLNYVSTYLHRLGYVTIAVTSGFHEVAFPSADRGFNHPTAFSMLEETLLQLTPIVIDPDPANTMNASRRGSLLAAIDNLNALALPTAQPRFIEAHLLAPHPPFSFDAQGNPVRDRHIPFGYWDGSHYMSVGGTPETYRRGYAAQVEFLNGKLEQLMANIRRQDPNAVILLEGDHGSKLGLDQENPDETDLPEAFGNLVAIYGPPSLLQRLYPTVTSVNTFRLVLDALFGERIPLLPDRSYYSPFSKPYRFTDVTGRTATAAR